MIVCFTPFIKFRLANRTMHHTHIFANCMLSSTYSTKNHLFTILFFRPNNNVMIFRFFMAFVTRIIFLTTFKLDSHNIFFRLIMNASSLLIYYRSIHFYLINKNHSNTLKQRNWQIHKKQATLFYNQVLYNAVSYTWSARYHHHKLLPLLPMINFLHAG